MEVLLPTMPLSTINSAIVRSESQILVEFGRAGRSPAGAESAFNNEVASIPEVI
jgi:hypothetical protein